MSLFFSDKLPQGATSRDLLEFIGGEEHALHTVVKKDIIVKKITFWCACGSKFTLENTKEYKQALRNVPEAA